MQCWGGPLETWLRNTSLRNSNELGDQITENTLILGGNWAKHTLKECFWSEPELTAHYQGFSIPSSLLHHMWLHEMFFFKTAALRGAT